MHVIWAKGQELGKYVHYPKSGLETEKPSVKDFYQPDELKYHGHGSQRGKLSLNFFEETKKNAIGAVITDEKSASASTVCNGEWNVPRNCKAMNKTCEYSAHWQFIPRKDEIRFTITTSHTDTWTGIGFSNNEKMVWFEIIFMKKL